jgi:hypothetical protein
MKMELTVEFRDGRKVKLNEPEALEECDASKEVNMVFINGEIYGGMFDGLDDEDEHDVNIRLKRGDHFIGLPYSKLLGWYYEESNQ